MTRESFIREVRPGHPQYTALQEHLEPKAKNGKTNGQRISVLKYNELAKAYNNSATGSIFEVHLPSNYRRANLIKILEGRDLQPQDYQLVAMNSQALLDAKGIKKDKDTPRMKVFILKKLGLNPMRVCDISPIIADSLARAAQKEGQEGEGLDDEEFMAGPVAEAQLASDTE